MYERKLKIADIPPLPRPLPLGERGFKPPSFRWACALKRYGAQVGGPKGPKGLGEGALHASSMLVRRYMRSRQHITAILLRDKGK